MPAQTGVHGYNTQLQRGDGATPENFTLIAMVKQGDFAVRLDIEDLTHLTSPGGFREKSGTLKEIQDIKIDVLFNPADATQNFTAGLGADLINKTKRNYKLVWPDGSFYQVKAFPTEVQIKYDPKSFMTAAITLTVDGQAGAIQ